MSAAQTAKRAGLNVFMPFNSNTGHLMAVGIPESLVGRRGTFTKCLTKCYLAPDAPLSFPSDLKTLIPLIPIRSNNSLPPS
jgi:hypothetical protein